GIISTKSAPAAGSQATASARPVLLLLLKSRYGRRQTGDHGRNESDGRQRTCVRTFRTAPEPKARDANQQRRKRAVDNRRNNKQKYHHARRYGGQALWRTETPLSFRDCCSSPAWNISRTISQPPTNSPLT